MSTEVSNKLHHVFDCNTIRDFKIQKDVQILLEHDMLKRYNHSLNIENITLR